MNDRMHGFVRKGPLVAAADPSTSEREALDRLRAELAELNDTMHLIGLILADQMRVWREGQL